VKRSIFALCLTATLAQLASGYVLEGQKWFSSPVFIQMNLSATTYRLQGRAPNFPLEDGSPSWESVYSSGALIWNQYLAQFSFFTFQGNNGAGGATNDGVNEVFFDSSFGGQQLDANTLAITSYSYDPSSGAMNEADTVFNSNVTWNSYRGPLASNAVDFRRVAMHEMGHILGLDHPDTNGQTVDAIMNSQIGDRDTLSGDDIAGGQSLYSGAFISPSGHFFGPGSDDILWRNTQTGGLFMWSMQGGTLIGSFLGNVPMVWKLAGTGDFNGDGYSDILWEDTQNYELVIWVMRGTSIVQTYVLPYELPVVAIRSFFNNGRSDILLRDYTNGQLYMLVNQGGGNFVEEPVGPPVSLGWAVIGAADVYGDGGSELFWSSGPSGEIVVWRLNGTTVVQAQLIGSLPAFWNITGFGDFNGDGKDDILLRNNQSGQIVAWIMSGLAITSEWFSGAPPLEWQITGISDIDGDGRKDVLLMYQPTGELYLWSGEPTYFSQTPIGTIGTNWAVEPSLP
jgi:hypothetical protein